MRVEKWVDFGQNVTLELSAEDVRDALLEAFNEVTQERLGEELPIHYVTRAFGDIGKFLNGFSDELIGRLNDEQRRVIATYLAKAADRFRK